MPLQVVPATPSDVPALMDIYFSAFQNLMAVTAFPDIPSVRTWWTKMIDEEILDPTALFLKVVDGEDGAEDGLSEIVAWGKWNKPVQGKEEDEPLPPWPEGGDEDVANRFFEQAGKKHKQVMGQRPHWYLELLATSPEHQGKGAGSMLLKHAANLADESGHETYLESSPEGVSIYHRNGFEDRERIEIDIKGQMYHNICMVRKPKK
ncbi:acyl-CoA N-acyltransferase [Aulographum hederae CBS 113979]|uniref:Acyl-CoA N-acyltransferase n=1 Tax=Aulographum hederae CBS 113979 TaxID=1176131 RepID=A0A6G1HD39_9PEZI|nr:acyl-CoA N-acyltransferase [Aulographum hederae CBS 113979]